MAGGATGSIRHPVLPDDPICRRVDDHDALAIVIVQRDRAVRERHGKARMAQCRPAGPWSVAPDHLALRGHPEDGAR